MAAKCHNTETSWVILWRNPLSSLFSCLCWAFPPVVITASDLMALKRSRSETLAPSPLINLLSFNLSASDTINLSASQPLWAQDAPASCIILRHSELSTALKKARQIRATPHRGHLKIIFIIKVQGSSERGAALNCRGCGEVVWGRALFFFVSVWEFSRCKWSY